MKIECKVYWISGNLSSYTNWLDEQGIIYEKKMGLQTMCDVFKMDEIDAIAFKLKFGL